MISSRNIWLSALVAAALFSAACNRTQRTDGARRFSISGTVLDRDEIHSRLTIAHQAVPGLMPAMTMPFRVANLSPAIQPGDAVRGTLVLESDEGWIADLTVTKKRDPSFVPPRPASVTAAPDFSLRNQNNSEIHLHTFRGKLVLLTFIYTRCPFPDYCPLMMKNFKAIRKLLAANTELARSVHLISVTIDPENDTPPVLHAYGERTIGGPDPFADWDLATGSPDEIRRLATSFGLTWYRDSGQITHSLATAIIAPDGKLIKVLAGNAWRPEDVLPSLRSALTNKPI